MTSFKDFFLLTVLISCFVLCTIGQESSDSAAESARGDKEEMSSSESDSDGDGDGGGAGGEAKSKSSRGMIWSPNNGLIYSTSIGAALIAPITRRSPTFNPW